MPKKKAPSLDVLDLAVGPNLDQRLARLHDLATKQAERWNLPEAVSIPTLNQAQFRKKVYSTGLLSLDKRIDIGGLPKGYITELFGSPGAGKSLLQYLVIKQVQHTCSNCHGQIEYFDYKSTERHSKCLSCKEDDTGGAFLLLDQENSFDPLWVRSQGVELSKLLVLKLPSGEQAVDMLRTLMNEHSAAGISIDSISQLQPQAERDRSMVDDPNMMGLHAKVMAQLCRHVVSSFLESPSEAPLFMWINQMRADVSGHGALKTTGGYAPEFYSGIRLYMLKRDQVNKDRPELGKNGRITIRKCKAARAAEMRTIDYVINDDGFDVAKDIYETAKNCEVFTIAGGSHYWPEEARSPETKLASSAAEALERVRNDAGFAAEVRKRVLSIHESFPQEIPEIYTGAIPEQP